MSSDLSERYEVRGPEPHAGGVPADYERIARACHEVNRAYCLSLGDSSQKPWSAADEWQRESAIKGVRFAIENPDATPADQHEAWWRDKIAAGWSYGPVKDAEKKEHPCCVPYEQLPVEQRTKDALFQAVVNALRDSSARN